MTGGWTLIPLAGPANRQGRIAADVIAGRDSRFRGTQGTSICQLFEAAIAQTGTSENSWKQLGDTDFDKIYLCEFARGLLSERPKCLAIKSCFASRTDGSWALGARRGRVSKRIDSFASGYQMGCTSYDLEEAELLRSPFGSAPKASELCGHGRSRRPAATRCAIGILSTTFLLDVRIHWLAVDRFRGHSNLPCRNSALAWRQAPRDREILVFCRSGQRAYYATRSSCRMGSKPAISRAACCHDLRVIFLLI